MIGVAGLGKEVSILRALLVSKILTEILCTGANRSQGRITNSYKNISNASRDESKYIREDRIQKSPISKITNRRKHFESQDKSCSPSIINITPPKVGYSPETPEYCPIINAQYRKDWMEKLKPDDEIIEFPLNFEEESESHRADFEITNITRTSRGSNGISPMRSKASPNLSQRSLQKSKSKDSLGYKDIHGNASLIRAFKNTP